jgi:hypothetical protein
VSVRGDDDCVHSDVRAGELTPQEASLDAATGRSQLGRPQRRHGLLP